MTRVLAVANQKGGVAKTTTVASLGAAFAEMGKRVLLIDLDAQACLTFSLGVDPDTVAVSINEVLIGQAGIREAIVDLALPHSQSPTADHVTLSMGVSAIVPGPESSLETLIAAADAALYQAEHEGRNRVILANPG